MLRACCVLYGTLLLHFLKYATAPMMSKTNQSGDKRRKNTTELDTMHTCLGTDKRSHGPSAQNIPDMFRRCIQSVPKPKHVNHKWHTGDTAFGTMSNLPNCTLPHQHVLYLHTARERCTNAVWQTNSAELRVDPRRPPNTNTVHMTAHVRVPVWHTVTDIVLNFV